MNALTAEQFSTMCEALASAAYMAYKASPGSREQIDANAQMRVLYLRLGPYLLTEVERSGFPANDLTHKE